MSEVTQPNARLVAEAKLALQSAPDVRAWPRNWESTGRIEYFYLSRHVLAKDPDLDRVRSTIKNLGAELPDDPAQREGGLLDGVTLLKPQWSQSRSTADLISDLDARLGNGVATHDHAFVVTYNSICPATEPEPVFGPAAAADPEAARDALWPQPADPTAGSGVRIAVVDTGLLEGCSTWAPWLQGVTPDTAQDIDDPDQVSVDPRGFSYDGYADPYAGHGTFVSGVVRAVAPASEIVVERVLDKAGFTTESKLVQQLRDALSRSPDVISMSAGGFTRNNQPSIAFRTLYDQWLSQLGGVVLVAAAGNDGSSDPFWPAAFPWCIGVGSLSKDGQRRSDFSNYGSWVDVYAPGEEIVNAYAQMKYKTIADGTVRDTSAGIVKWSGTSFSTPIVSGLIAARMSRTGETARAAADVLLEAARRQFRPGIGPRLFP